MKIPSRETLHRWILTRDTPVFVQVTKYGICGAIGTVMQAAIALTLSATVIPAFEGMSIDGEPISDALRQRNLVINNLVAFPFANLVTYFLNTRLVFTPGRHSRIVEFGIFSLIAAIGFLAGLFGGPLLIKRFGLSTLFAQVSLVVTSALVNFLCRKFIVFEK